MFWMLFVASLPVRAYTNWLAFFALIFGLLKRHGIPKFSRAYAQTIVFDENLQSLPYLGVVALIGGLSFILYVPLVLQAYLELSPIFKLLLDKNPNVWIFSIPFIQKHILNCVNNK